MGMLIPVIKLHVAASEGIGEEHDRRFSAGSISRHASQPKD